MRKISTKVAQSDQRPKRLELKSTHNQYYLPHPQLAILKTPKRDVSQELQKDKNMTKLARNASQYAPLRMYSTTQFKGEVQNPSKEQESTPINRHNLGKKVEGRKFRSASNCETPKRSISKSILKLQLNNQKKEEGGKRINLKMEASKSKKNDKHAIQDAEFDSYYNNECPNTQSKTIRVQKKVQLNNSYSSNNSQFNQLFNRCKKLIQQYEFKLENAKKENRLLHEQNNRLRQQQQAERRVLLQSRKG